MLATYFQNRAKELDLTADDIAFELARLDVKVTGQAVRNWLAGTNGPSLTLADALAIVLKTDRETILAAMHAIATARASK